MSVLRETPPLKAWRAAVERTTRWAQRSLARFRETEPRYGHPQYPVCIVQGGSDPGLRRRSVEELLQLDTPVYAVGGLAVGEPREELFATLELLDRLLPRDRPRYLMGVGTPADLVRAVGQGMDMFDCVLPTRNARNGQLFTAQGTLTIRNARYRDDLDPVMEDCDCLLCAHFNRAYLRHLFNTKETLGLRLATVHNLKFYFRLMAAMRAAIADGRFPAWSREYLQTYEGGTDE